MSILIRKPGILTTFQDLGRLGFRRFGINPTGVMDRTATRLINTLIGNDENETVLEMHFPAPEIVFESVAELALGGADFAARLNDTPLENWRTYFAEKDSVLRFTSKIFGQRAYLTIQNGFQLDNWLESGSTNLKAKIGGFDGRSLQKDDRFPLKKSPNLNHHNSRTKISDNVIPFYSPFPTIRVIKNAEFDILTKISRAEFLNQSFRITTNSDRMGFRLAGNPLRLQEVKELASSAVNFGTIQLLPDGQLIVLMADHQTTGGYPRIATVIPTDLPLLAQLGVNDKFAFHLVSDAEAEELFLQLEQDLNFLRTACKFRKPGCFQST